MKVGRWLRRFLRWSGPRVAVWHHPAYRLPVGGLEAGLGIEPRRADLVAWYLGERGTIARNALRTPSAISWADLARVHTDAHLESLGDARTLARIFVADPDHFPVDEVLQTVRLACGATLEAARDVVRRGGAALNLLGGFHHAGPQSAGGLCPVNDVAVAVMALRAGGLKGPIVVLDLDAHPPDGTAACLGGEPATWIGSIDVAAEGWNVDAAPNLARIIVPLDTTDERYLEALEQLLGQMPQAPALAFVIAGGDVLAGDRLGRLGLTLGGARQRDLRVAGALSGVPSVWLPGGGYHRDAWRVLAGTALAVAEGSEALIPAEVDPVRAEFARLSAALRVDRLAGRKEGDFLDADDVADELGIPGARPRRLLGFYSAEGLDYAFHRFGLLEIVRRLGYENLHVALDTASGGERLRLLGRAGGTEHVLVEAVVALGEVAGVRVLYVNWLSLRDPLATFRPGRPRLPGQDVPGLGLAREAGEMLARMAFRVGAAGVAFRPAWYHTAYAARDRFRFVDPERQGRFEAMVRDLAGLALLEATAAVAEKRVLLAGEPYEWEADEMVFWLDSSAPGPGPGIMSAAGAAQLEAARERSRFTLIRRATAPAAGAGPA